MVRLLVNTIFAKVMRGYVPGKPLHKVSQPRTLMAERKTDRERREGECVRLTLSHPPSVTRIQDQLPIPPLLSLSLSLSLSSLGKGGEAVIIVTHFIFLSISIVWTRRWTKFEWFCLWQQASYLCLDNHPTLSKWHVSHTSVIRCVVNHTIWCTIFPGMLFIH